MLVLAQMTGFSMEPESEGGDNAVVAWTAPRGGDGYRSAAKQSMA